jgi:2-polyprenyl-6-methoxyphenol hydroxylase-like FAD-dependent oxidoreductase
MTPSPPPPAETEVCIVGAGPVGSALAIDLRMRGVDCVVVERQTGLSYDMRAMNNDMRTMELLRRWGVADELRALNPVPPQFQHDICFCTALHEHELGVWHAYGWRPEDARELAAEPGQPISQMHTNRTLRAGAEASGATVATGWQCTGVEQSELAATVRLEATDGSGAAAVRAAYVVACDGGRSTARAAVGIAMAGAGGMGKHLHAVVGCDGLLDDLPVSSAAFYIVFNKDAGGLVLPSGPGEFNFHLAGFEPDEDVSGLDLPALARTVTGLDRPMEIRSTSPYLIHELIADRYRAGRVLIAGDAAHLFCPFGGFNMNTGIGDVGNLGWKLAARVHGWGGDGLLDSYESERRPIALRNSAEATFNVEALVAAVGEIMGSGLPDGDDPVSDATRRAAGEELYQRTHREWNTAGVVLDQRYASAVIVDDGSDPPSWDVTRYQPFAKPGHRAPHAWLDGTRSLYDELGLGFALLDFGDATGASSAIAQAAADRQLPLKVIRIADPAIRDVYGAPLALIRPDQHVAWRGAAPSGDPLELVDTVRGLQAPAAAAQAPLTVTSSSV